jgi:hypothetical protein
MSRSNRATPLPIGTRMQAPRGELLKTQGKGYPQPFPMPSPPNRNPQPKKEALTELTQAQV